MIEYLDADKQALAEATRDFARGRLLDLDRRCDREGGSICAALPEMAEMGLMALRLSPDVGGLGCDRLTYAAVLHELAYASPSAAVTLSVHNMVGEVLVRFARPAVQERLLPHWGTAEYHGSFAISEADAGSDPGASRTTAVLDDGRWTINGSKMWITSSAQCRWFVILVQTRAAGDRQGLCMVLLDAKQPGFERLPIKGKMGIRASETFSLHFSNVTAPEEHLLGGVGAGLKIALAALDGGRIGIAAQATGIAQACLDEMVAYARQRTQFGRPIGHFQAIENMIADSTQELAAAKALIVQACRAIECGLHSSAVAARAKLYASEMAGRVADRAVQVHGGTGYVNDSRVEQLYRDARVTRIYEGTSEIQRVLIARDLLANATAKG